MKYRLAAVLEPKDPKWKQISAGLKRAGLKVSSAREPEQLEREQLVVIGPGAKSASRVCSAARKVAPTALVLAAQATGFKAAWADAVLPLPVSPNDLKVRLADFERRDPVQSPPMMPHAGEGILDPLTNFYTFGHFKEVLFVEVKRARRYGFPLAIALIGFDPVKVKPSPGLQEQLMGGLALAIRRSLRDTDYPVQQGPDRVLLLMPHTDLAGSLIVARRICERVSRATLQHGDEVLSPTISVGVAAGEPGREYGFSDLVRQAQDGLQAAQSKGGNRVEFFDSAAYKAEVEERGTATPPSGTRAVVRS
ncbi:MAG: GGDEF domain-containing protein [Archangiaceae bacterium]|nr:GGDEF domain-containing protein [Archangiaceae bacterium]